MSLFYKNHVFLLSCCIAFSIFFSSVTLYGQTPGSVDGNFENSGFDRLVQDILILDNNKILVSGEFRRYGFNFSSSLVCINDDGTYDNGFQRLSIENTSFPTINALAQQDDGKILIGGNFLELREESRNGIARLNEDGSFDIGFTSPLEPYAEVHDISILPNSKILVAGNNLTSENGFKELVCLNPDGSIDNEFAAENNNGYRNHTIKFLSSGKILVGGTFTEYQGQVVGHLVLLNANGSKVEPPNIFNYYTGANDDVYTFYEQNDGKILVGGAFDTYTNQNCGGIIRINPDGSVDPTFNPGAGTNGIVNSITVDKAGKITLGGDFSEYNGTAVGNIVRLNADGSIDQENIFREGFKRFNGVDFATVNKVIIDQNDKILIGGDFSKYNEESQFYFSQIQTDYDLVIPLEVTFPDGENASLRAKVYPKNLPLNIYFEWGDADFSSINFQNTTATQRVNSLDTGQVVSQLIPISSFDLNAFYGHGFRAVAQEDAQPPFNSIEQRFTIKPSANIISEVVYDVEANMNGEITTNNLSVDLWVQWGEYDENAIDFSSNFTHQSYLGNFQSLVPQNFIAPFSDLRPSTEYNYRIRGLIGGLSDTITLISSTFQTSGPEISPPTLMTLSSSEALMNISFSPNDYAITLEVEWGLTDSYGNSQLIGNFAGSLALSQDFSIVGLSELTTYHYRIKATFESILGEYTVFYNDQTFFTPSTTQPLLEPGDVVITATISDANSGDETPTFEILPLVELTPGTKLLFTDIGWQNNNQWLGNNADPSSLTDEGTGFYIVPEGGLPVGIPVTLPFFANIKPWAGDQVIIFQRSYLNPHMIFALNFGDWESNATDATNSAVPMGLTEDLTAIDLPSGPSNFIYTGNIECGFKEDWLRDMSITRPTDYSDSPGRAGNWRATFFPDERNSNVKALPRIGNLLLSPSVSLSASVNEVAEDGGSIAITATLNEVFCGDVQITVAFAGTAILDTDYKVNNNGVIVIPSGELQGSIGLAPTLDELPEGDEIIFAEITSIDRPQVEEDGEQNIIITITENVVTPIPADEFPGGAVSFGDDSDNEAVIISGIELGEQLTFEAWFRPLSFDGSSGILMGEENGASIKWFYDNGNYTVEFYIFDGSNLIGPATHQLLDEAYSGIDDQWFHLASTYDGSSLQLYVNGVKGTAFTYSGAQVSTLSPFYFGKATTILSYGSTELLLDEVRIWKVARTQTEIRETQHLTLIGNEPDLLAYWQFNESSGTLLKDITQRYDAQIENVTQRVTSTIPVGSGTSYTASSLPNTTVDYEDTGLEISFGSIHPEGDLVVTRLPNLTPAGSSPITNHAIISGYWIINNYGNNTGLSPMKLRFSPPSNELLQDSEELYRLIKRPSNSYGDWEDSLSASGYSKSNWIEFEGIQDFSQFALSVPNNPLPVSIPILEGKRVNTQDVLLTWKVNSSVEVISFVLEKSQNGLDFSPTTTVSPHLAQLYRYLDKDTPGAAYYRLTVVLSSEIKLQSNIVFVDGDVFAWSLYPNPGTDDVYLKPEGNWIPNQSLKINIMTPQGNLMKQYTGSLDVLRKSLNLWVKDTPPGLYIVVVETGQSTQRFRWIKN